MELLQFVFSSFWVWLGCVVLIVAAGEAVATAAAGFRQKRKVSVYHVGDVTRVEVENAGRADIPAAVIMPYVISKKFADELEELSYQCRHFLNTRSAFATPAAEDEEEPDENQTTTFDAEAAEDTE